MTTINLNGISALVFPAGIASATVLNDVATINLTGGGGGGSVTNFSSGNLGPLFTTSVANPATTPAQTFSLNTQTANLVFAGPTSGGAVAPTFRSLVTGDLPSLSTIAVTSLTGDTIVFNNSGSQGAVSLALVSQSPNKILAGPTSGGAVAPTFRSLVVADIPTLTQANLPAVIDCGAY